MTSSLDCYSIIIILMSIMHFDKVSKNSFFTGLWTLR